MPYNAQGIPSTKEYMMSVIAKFRVQPPIENYGANINVKLMAITPSDGDDEVTRNENESFWNATPSGQITLNITNPSAAEQFQVGDDWYVELRRAEKTEAPTS
jgi:hypothetical protein